MRLRIFFLLMVLSPVLSAQEEASYEKYREDQFYFGISYNLLLDLPEEASRKTSPMACRAGLSAISP